jgi:hypothetical protein
MIVVATLMALIAPAIQAAREAARGKKVMDNLRIYTIRSQNRGLVDGDGPSQSASAGEINDVGLLVQAVAVVLAAIAAFVSAFVIKLIVRYINRLSEWDGYYEERW